jgi:hypothetical protein
MGTTMDSEEKITTSTNIHGAKKGKVILVTGRGGP